MTVVVDSSTAAMGVASGGSTAVVAISNNSGDDSLLPSFPILPPPFAVADGGDNGFQTDDSPKTPSIDEDNSPEKHQTTGGLKKPDKILPCPRCESMNTSLLLQQLELQPSTPFLQELSKVLDCRRHDEEYVDRSRSPEEKNASSDCHFIISHEAFDVGPQIEFAADNSDWVYNTSRQPKVLSFTPNSPLCRGKESGDDCSSGTTTVVSSNSVVEKPHEINRFHSQVHWIPGTPWSYNPWVLMQIPTGYPPIPFYPPPYWNSVSWLPPVTSAPNYSILGKHSSDRVSINPIKEPKKQKNSILIPKTLRIDDPDEAAQSSIWATLRIKNENCIIRDIFKGFQAKGDEKKKQPTEPSLLLQANPAAFSRSLYFQERA
ncbi:unnamed protein product [Lactuca virosa]|uniref:Uncharacterized protein n=1 Tax=Lactuca virosa TaxID=75947 RepID=A0AAU9M8L2_9ASTR|nr:unnamed protein product [Lactuca virosa]